MTRAAAQATEVADALLDWLNTQAPRTAPAGHPLVLADSGRPEEHGTEPVTLSGLRGRKPRPRHASSGFSPVSLWKRTWYVPVMKAPTARSSSANDRRGGVAGLPWSRYPGSSGQQLSIKGAEQALNLASALWPADGGVDDAETETGSHLVEVMTGEVAAVIDVERVRDAANRPGMIGLAPGCMAQREAGVQHTRRVKEYGVAGDGAGVIVHDRGQPGAGGLAALIEDVEVEQRVVRLPDSIGCFGTEAVDHLKVVPERGRPLLRQRHHAWIEGSNNRIDRAVGGDAPASCFCSNADAAMDGSR